jgi:hypothetical protein
MEVGSVRADSVQLSKGNERQAQSTVNVMTLSYVVLTVLSLMAAVEVGGDPYHLAHSQPGAMPPKRGEKLKESGSLS